MVAVIRHRQKVLVNTDPLRRCYDGHHCKSEIIWTNWAELEAVDSTRADQRLAFWRELNDYAVSQRGESARKEFSLQP